MSWFIKFFSSILAVFIFSSSAEIAAYSPIDKDNMLTSFTVISDAHLESNNRQKHTLFGEFLLDTVSAEVKSSALVMCGDNTMNGQTVEKSMLYGLIDKYNTTGSTNDKDFLVDEINKAHKNNNYLDVVEKVLNEIGCIASECIMIGDSKDKEILAASNIGMKAILFDYNGKRDKSNLKLNNYNVIKNLRELKDIL